MVTPPRFVPWPLQASPSPDLKEATAFMANLEKALLEHFPYAHFVLSVGPDSELTLRLCNRIAAQLYGLNPGTLPGQQLHHVLIPQVADGLEQVARRCLNDKKMVISPALSVHPVTAAVQSFTAAPVIDDKGVVTHVTITALPFEATTLGLQTERDQALMMMTSAFDASNLGILVTDRERRVLRVNQAFLSEFGFRRRHIIGMDFTQVFVPTDRRSAARAYKEFLRGQTEARHEWRLKSPNDKQPDVLVTTAPLHLHPDRPLAVHTFVDISEHKHLEESLRWAKEQADSANRAKSAFLASMSHELRTPLNAILGFSELIRNETFGPLGHNKYAEYLNDIHFAASHLLEIINDVLDMSKIEAGKFELFEENFSTDDLFQAVIRVMADRAAAKNIPVRSRIDPAVSYLHADKRVLRQMLFNLLSNAIKFSYPDGPITLSAELDKARGDVLLVVKDVGRGIDPRDIERVLEPFNQGQATVSDGTGTGLGLPLTRAMAELHGGVLEIDSDLGEGTCVTIRLPAERIATNGTDRRRA